MTALTITHTSAEGTMIEGTARGDGSAQVLKANRWRWGRSIGAWYIPRSRDAAPKRATITQTARDLEAAGFTVAVEIDATPRDGAEVEADTRQRSAERADALADRAAKHHAASDAAYQRADAISERFAFGQPILTDHYSAKGARADQKRMHASMDKCLAEADYAEELEHRESAAAAATSRRNAPRTVGKHCKKFNGKCSACFNPNLARTPLWSSISVTALCLLLVFKHPISNARLSCVSLLDG